MRQLVLLSCLAVAAVTAAIMPPIATQNVVPHDNVVVIKVCTAGGTTPSCTGNCSYYAMPSEGCRLDPTDPGMSFHITCESGATCANYATFNGGGCNNSQTIDYDDVPCDACSVSGPSVTCGPLNKYGDMDWIELKGDCTSNNCSSCSSTIATVPASSGCTNYTVGGQDFSASLFGSTGTCLNVHFRTYENAKWGQASCAEATMEENAELTNGECAYSNLDDEGYFNYAFLCVDFHSADTASSSRRRRLEHHLHRERDFDVAKLEPLPEKHLGGVLRARREAMKQAKKRN